MFFNMTILSWHLQVSIPKSITWFKEQNSLSQNIFPEEQYKHKYIPLLSACLDKQDSNMSIGALSHKCYCMIICWLDTWHVRFITIFGQLSQITESQDGSSAPRYWLIYLTQQSKHLATSVQCNIDTSKIIPVIIIWFATIR